LWRKGQYYFKNVTLHDIARDIERLFGVRVLIENEDLLNTHYHIALVNGETVDDFLRILSMDNSLKVARSGNTIIIK
jgi:prophage tail gpP-like protein